MSRKPKKASQILNCRVAIYTADGYMRMAERECRLRDVADHLKMPYEIDATSLITSSFAFSLEIYFKIFIYYFDNRVANGHDLDSLWKQLPPVVSNWISNCYSLNQECIHKKWSAQFKWSNIETKWQAGKFKTPASTAAGIIDGHRRAFAIGRYAYELPENNSINITLSNIPGLRLLSQIVRALAADMVNRVEKEKKARKEALGKQAYEYEFPSEKIEIFPPYNSE